MLFIECPPTIKVLTARVDYSFDLGCCPKMNLISTKGRRSAIHVFTTHLIMTFARSLQAPCVKNKPLLLVYHSIEWGLD